MVKILIMSAKIATLGLLKIKVFWNKGYNVMVSVRDVTKKILPRVSNYIVNVVMWPKFGHSSISMREVIVTFNCFKFNNLRLAFGMATKFYVSVAKGLKLKARKFWRPVPTFVEVAGKNC